MHKISLGIWLILSVAVVLVIVFITYPGLTKRFLGNDSELFKLTYQFLLITVVAVVLPFSSSSSITCARCGNPFGRCMLSFSKHSTRQSQCGVTSGPSSARPWPSIQIARLPPSSTMTK
jgi:hypothetical protein